MRKPSAAVWFAANLMPFFWVHVLVRSVGTALPPLGLSILGFSSVVAIVTLLHWAVLKKWFEHARRWALATLVGTTGGALAGFWVFRTAEKASPFGESLTIDAAASMAVSGAILGLCQGWTLPRTSKGAGWWVAASSVGFAVAGALYQSIWDLLSVLWSWNFLRGLNFPGRYELALLVFAIAIYGIVTGPVWRIVRHEDRHV